MDNTELTKCHVSISTPGTLEDAREFPIRTDEWKIVEMLLKEHGKEFQVCDTLMGWGNLDQDWIEWYDDVETSWGWCRPNIFTTEEWEWVFDCLNKGKLLMQIYYYYPDREDKEKYVAHH